MSHRIGPIVPEMENGKRGEIYKKIVGSELKTLTILGGSIVFGGVNNSNSSYRWLAFYCFLFVCICMIVQRVKAIQMNLWHLHKMALYQVGIVCFLSRPLLFHSLFPTITGLAFQFIRIMYTCTKPISDECQSTR